MYKLYKNCLLVFRIINQEKKNYKKVMQNGYNKLTNSWLSSLVFTRSRIVLVKKTT